MHRLLALLLALSLPLAGCGAVEFRGAINLGHASGTVSIVSLTITSDQVMITVVTLAQTGSATTLNFCGDQRSQFPLNTFVRADFTPGNSCNTIVTISVR